MTWYRIYFRTKNIVVEGEAERDRICASKVPKVHSVEVAKEHTCSICGKVEAWDPDKWSWFGSYKQMEDGKPVVKFCSQDCANTHKAKRKPAKPSGNWRVRQHGYTGNPDKDDRAWVKQREAKEAANVRKFHPPQFPKERTGNGWCRWCGEKVTEKNRKTWHSECLHQFFLHTSLDAQRRHLAKRDGECCALCPPGYGKWLDAGPWPSWYAQGRPGHYIKWSQVLEVDHVIPLYRIDEFETEEERRAMFGPSNLWLLCQTHHRWKNSLEAKDRAERRQAAS